MMKKALLIIDRGSRVPDVRMELEELCSLIKSQAGYQYVDYCFLEVLPPFIPEGLDRCIESGAHFITVMPYFLYPGMKLKDSVKQSARIGHDRKLRLAIAKPLSYHSMMTDLVIDRISELKEKNKINYSDSECDVLLIGHGSSDKSARNAFVDIANSIKSYYRNVHFCFLELDHPNIDEGIGHAVTNTNPKVLLIMPYFLHRGAHIKKDVIMDVTASLEKYNFRNAFISRHLGVDQKLVDLVMERAKEAENRFGILQ
jgi:precorrin-8X/cobalt-precorrin-8 methylmutase